MHHRVTEMVLKNENLLCPPSFINTQYSKQVCICFKVYVSLVVSVSECPKPVNPPREETSSSPPQAGA